MLPVKYTHWDQTWWLRPTLLATQEAEIGTMLVQGWFGTKFKRPYLYQQKLGLWCGVRLSSKQ
jgi:hypothetical protein